MSSVEDPSPASPQESDVLTFIEGRVAPAAFAWALALPPPDPPGTGDPTKGYGAPSPSDWSGWNAPIPTRHLGYALLWELTGVPEIFARTVQAFADGERLGVPSLAIAEWVRRTEAYFFRPGAPYSLVSAFQPDDRETRWRAYYRMFGADLGVRGAAADGANIKFPDVAQEMFEHLRTGIAAKEAALRECPDDVQIAQLSRQLKQMLKARRRGGNLAREEQVAVALMCWYANALADNSPLVQGLSLSGATPGERLEQLGRRVGVAPHPNSEELIELAWPLETVLLLIERYDFSSPDFARELYKTQQISNLISVVILHWPALLSSEPIARSGTT
jgi:hypothetical protein